MASAARRRRAEGQDRQSAHDLALRDPLQVARSPAPPSPCCVAAGRDARHSRRLPAGHRQGLRRRGGGDIAPQFNYLLRDGGRAGASRPRCRFYFVSWLGERVVADIRVAVHAICCASSPRFFEENRPSEIASRLTVRHRGDRAGRRHDRLGRAAQHRARRSAASSILFTLAPKLDRLAAARHPADRRCRSSCSAAGCATISRSSQDRIADVGAIVAETLGAMKIVQAFGQEERESEPLPRRGRARLRDRPAADPAARDA